MTPESNPTVKHETRDINVKALAMILFSVIGVSVLILLLVRGVYRANEDYVAPADKQSVYWTKADVPASTSPHLEIDLAGSLLQSRQQQQKQLTTFGWVDRPAGIVHIPIDQAMRHILDKGVPDWQKPEKPATKMDANEKKDAKPDANKEQKP